MRVNRLLAVVLLGLCGSLFSGDSVLQGRVSYVTNTPAQITANKNNYWLGSATVFRLSSDASRNITGFDRGYDGRLMILINAGSNDIVLMDQDAASDANNRIITGDSTDCTLAAGDLATLIYDGSTARWRLRSVHRGSAPISGTLTAGTIPKASSASQLTDSDYTEAEVKFLMATACMGAQ